MVPARIPLNFRRVTDSVIRFRGSILVLIMATLLTLGALNWMGYDVAHVGDAFIGNGGDTYATSWMIFQAMDNLVHRPFDLGYSTIYYGEKSSFAFTVA